MIAPTAKLLLPLAVASGGAAAQQQSRPNIILIMTDQHRFDCIGYYGNSSIKTPNLDALARDGLFFTNGYSSTPSSTPARAALLTGMSPWHHGMLGYSQVARQYPVEMPRMLSEAGYYTMAIGKMHYSPQREMHGFDAVLLDESGRVESFDFMSDYRRWFLQKSSSQDPDKTGLSWNDNREKPYQLAENLHPTWWTGEKAVEFIRSYKQNKPLLLKISFARPHSPYDAPQRYLDMYEGVEIPVPWIGNWCSDFKDREHVPDPAFGDFGVDFAVASRRNYYANITFIDDWIGEIIKELKDRGMYENSVIIFTSDHGDMLGDHYHWRKTYAYEGSTHVPYIVKFPAGVQTALPKGASAEQCVELRDIMPTALEVAGVEIPTCVDGESLLTIARHTEPKWREYIDLEHATTYDKANYWVALTDGKFKYVYNLFNGAEQLFRLESDPHELFELSAQAEYGETLKRWRTRMVEHLSERGERYVVDGKLKTIEKTILLSPNYPKY
ncbi:Choline-sulfatase [Mucinivorans hirudinis]|uniref:Choline-sulfatase n=1 Tax=Mucinivorans hirudinis TaxID=1433126 RepID=A0A060R824_9BACT|nr:Choline-sulfatase [Mucinivorans hirudinis]